MSIRGLRTRKNGLLACIAAMALLSYPARAGQASQEPGAQKPLQRVEVDSEPEVQPITTSAKQADDKAQVAADAPAQKDQLAADKARLLRLAAELRRELSKSGTDTLSISVIRKADEIQKLARSVKQEMNRNLKAAR
jgi:hypothetical protein